MDEQEVERLLYSGESDALDFKRDQYPLTNNDEKGELVKDILAFANSWRTTEAFILVGVDETKVAGKSTLVGVSTHLKDSDIQQLVNSKTNRKVTFIYEPVSFQGYDIGVIMVPVQERPSVLTGNFGKLSKDTVYVRRGSSTDTAGATEILNMARASISPSFTLELADIENRQRLGTSITLNSTIVTYDNDKIPLKRFAPFSPQVMLGLGNTHYYRHLARYIAEVDLLSEIGFYVRNEGSVLAPNVRVVIQASVDPTIAICDSGQYPEHPDDSGPRLSFLDKVDIKVHGAEWTLNAEFGSIQPKASAWSIGSFYIGATKNTKLDLVASIYADNLPNPVVIPLTIKIDVDERNLDLSELEIEP